MRTFILFLLAWLLLCAQAGAQQLTAAEYFVDTDPGVGNGTAVAINAGDVVTATYNVSGTGIPEGFHTLSTRFMDANGTWGIAVSRLFYVYGSVTGGSDPAPPVTAGEYFIDSDPGTGAATAFSVSQGDQVTAAFSVDGTGLIEGFHTMSVRLKDTEGHWGIATSRLFYVYGSVTGGSDPAPPVTAGEYFIDSDPGTGAATAFSVSQGDQVTAAFSVDGTGLLEGFHTMSVRLKDTEGHWGIAVSRLFYVYGGNGGGVDPASPIAAAEYFFDVDPGVGNGTALPTGVPQDSVSVNTVIDASALPIGAHVLSIRMKDTGGHWGIAKPHPFTVCTFDGPLAAFDFVKDNMAVNFTNQSQNQLNCLWDFGDGSTSTDVNPFHAFTLPGVYNVCLVAYNPCLVEGDTICQSVAVVGLASVTPNDLANTGNFILDITGAGLTGLLDLRLVKDGMADLLPDSVVIDNDELVRASFTFNEAPVGTWTVQGIIAPADTVVIQQAVNLSPPVEPELWVNIAGDGVLRVGFSQVYTVTIGNDGNLDAYWPTVFLENLPIGTEFVFLDSLYGGESVPAYDTLGIDWAEVRHLNLVDSTNMTSFFPFQVRRIPAHGAISIGVIFHIPDSTELHTYYDITAMVTGPVYTSAESEGFRSISYECMQKLVVLGMKEVIELSSLGECATGIGSLLVEVYDAHRSGTNILSVPGILVGAVETTAECLLAAGSIVTPFGLGVYMWKYRKIVKAIEELSDYVDGYELAQTCGVNGVNTPVATSAQNVIIGNAWDPNEKYGPGGGNHGQYMNAGKAWPYTIGFENDPAANLPAQTVTVIDSLDLTRFDMHSFGFTSVTVGMQSIGLNGKPMSFIRDFDMQASMGVNMRVAASCDTVTGVVRWVFNTIDPSTGQNTLNALDGFLPPDTLSPNGQGYVSFVVDLLPGMSDADSIRNKATIIFDFNEPIVTSTWQNVLDLLAPSSHVDPLPSIIQTDSAFISWSGVDTLSGIRHYTIYVEKDHEGYLPWLMLSEDTAAWFQGEYGSIYNFYSVATDSAGNAEEPPVDFDATTEFVDPDIGIKETSGGDLSVAVVPNPNQGRFELRLNSNRPRRSLIQITDMLGQPVHTEETSIQAGRTVCAMEFPSIAPGIYLITIHSEGHRLNLRWIKN